jgi:hypothetical protein
VTVTLVELRRLFDATKWPTDWVVCLRVDVREDGWEVYARHKTSRWVGGMFIGPLDLKEDLELRLGGFARELEETCVTS